MFQILGRATKIDWFLGVGLLAWHKLVQRISFQQQVPSLRSSGVERVTSNDEVVSSNLAEGNTKTYFLAISFFFSFSPLINLFSFLIPIRDIQNFPSSE